MVAIWGAGAVLALSLAIAPPLPGVDGRGAAATPIAASPCDPPPGFAAPFTRIYRLRDGRVLVFVAVQHGRDPDDASHRMIATAIARFKPDLVYVEGIDTETPAAIAFQREAAARQAQSGAIQETLYTVKLASERGIAFAAWDYSPTFLMRHDVDQGFALPDVIGAHMMRDGVDPNGTGASEASRRELSRASRIAPLDGFDYAAWYRGNYTTPVSLADASPCGSGVASRILRAESDVRSAHLAMLIAAPAPAGRVILVEAGANHWLALRDYLRGLSTSVE